MQARLFDVQPFTDWTPPADASLRLVELRAMIASGVHPTGRALMTDGGTCGSCGNLTWKLDRRGNRVAPKCGLSWDPDEGPRIRSDVVLSWPMCVEARPATTPNPSDR